VGEIRAYGGSKKSGAGVVRFTQEKGAASSFERIMDEMVKVFSQKGAVLPDQ
jgi:Fungal kinase associated-1 domain